MMTLEEKKLKILLRKREAIDKEIEKISSKILLTKIIVMWSDVGKRELLKILKEILDENQNAWFNLILISPDLFEKSISIFGKRSKIASNLRKIVNKIVLGEGWRMRDICVGPYLLMHKLEYMI